MARDLRLEVLLNAVDKVTTPLRAITRSSGATAEALKASREQLKQLKAQQRDVDSFRQLAAANEETAAALQASRQKLAELGRQTATVRQQLAPLNALYEESTRRLDAEKASNDASARALKAVRAERTLAREEFKKATASIASYNERLAQGIDLSADERAELARLIAGQTQRRASIEQLEAREKKLAEQHTESSRKLRLVRDGHKAVRQEMLSIKRPHDELLRQYKEAKAATERLGQQYGKQQHDLQGLQGKLAEAGIKTSRLGAEELRLKQKLTETNRAIEQQAKALERATRQQKQLSRAKQQYESLQSVAGSMSASGAAGLATGTGILYAGARMIAPSIAAQQQGSMIAAQGGESTEQAKQYAAIIRGIRADGLSDDMAAIGTAVAAVRSTLGDLGEAGLDRASRKAMDLSAVLGGDVAEHVQTVGILLQNKLAGSSDEAFDLLTAGLQQVSTQMRGELPEILHEYSTHFRGMGYTGAEAMGLLVTMAKQGKFALDKTGDAIKEFSIRGSDMSKASVGAYEALGFNAAKMSSAVASGGDEAKQALQQTAKALLEIADPAERANTAIALFGTPVEDLAVDQIPAFLQAMAGAGEGIGDVAGKSAALGKTLRDNLGGDVQAMAGAWSELNSTLADSQAGPLRQVTQGITQMLGSLRAWVQENPALAAGLVKAAMGLGMLVAAGGAVTLVLASMLGPFAIVRYAMAVTGIRAASLGGALMRLGKYVLPFVGKGSQRLVGALGMLVIRLGLLRDAFFRALPAILGAARIFMTSLLQAVQAPLKLLIVSLGKFAWLLISRIPMALSMAAKAALLLGRALLLNPIGLAVTAIAGAAYLIWSNWSTLGPKFDALWSSIKSLTAAAFGAITTAIAGAWGQIKAAFAGGLSGIAALILNWSPLGLFYQAFAGVMGWFGVDLPGKFSEFGANILQGLVTGITSKLGAVKEAIMGAGDAVTGWFKEKLGIHSPSRVFAELGGWTMAGLDQGLTAAQAGPLKTVAQTAKQLTAAGTVALGASMAMPALADLPSAPAFDTRPPLSAASAAPGGGSGGLVVQGDTINITIQAAPGSDTAALRQMIEQLLQERERGKAARLRSALHDRE